MHLSAVVLNCSLKPSPAASNTEALANVVLQALRDKGVSGDIVRVVDHQVDPGVESEAQSDGDEWPSIRAKVVAADIVILATPTWLGQISSVCQRTLERMDAFLSETQEDGRPITYDKVAGFVVTGNEDGAHHCIAQMAQCMIDLGFTVPGQAWTYWNKGPGPGEEEYLNSSEVDWSNTTGKTAAQNVLAVAQALRSSPLPAPVS
jgi:multimeric flavodoxin WrbA